jgi:hypothetical protein
MKRFILLLVLVGNVVAASQNSPSSLWNSAVSVAKSGSACGTERWDVKTLSDPAAPSLLTTTKFTTVDALRAMPVPGALALHTPRFPQERQVYTVRGNVKGAKLEADQDFHVVIADTVSGKTMIVEFSDPACVANATWRPQIDAARKAFVGFFGTPVATKFSTLSGSAQFTGVLFFDKLHGQRGVAPNGVELHPVLQVMP